MGLLNLSGGVRRRYPLGMRRFRFAALAFMAVSPSFAQVKVVAELVLPSAPSAAPAGAFMPAFPMPALGPALSAPSLAASPLAAAPAPAPAPAAAQTALVQTGFALAAAAKDGGDQGAVSRRAFDAGAKTPAEAPAVSGAESAPRAPALEEPNSPRHRVVFEPMGPVKTAVTETAEVAALSIPVAIAALIMKATMTNPAFLIPAMVALWAAGAWAMRGHLAGLRSTVVGGWQASHDQKYRVDPNTGQIRDIRGHKYGSDRYEEWKDGPVGPVATGLIAAASAVAAAAFLLL